MNWEEIIEFERENNIDVATGSFTWGRALCLACREDRLDDYQREEFEQLCEELFPEIAGTLGDRLNYRSWVEILDLSELQEIAEELVEE